MRRRRRHSSTRDGNEGETPRPACDGVARRFDRESNRGVARGDVDARD